MRKGGSKAKGGSFENVILRQLRKVYPDAYKTIGSGNASDDKGDIIFKHYCIECKHHCDFTDGIIDKFWEKIIKEAETHNKQPALVYKTNRRKPLVMFNNYVKGRPIRVMMYFDEWLEEQK
jgi:Holliday junction resolvase